MSCTPDFLYTLEVISGRAVSHLSMGDDWDAFAVSPESLPLTTPELPAQNPDHNLFMPIDLEPLPPPIMNILDLQEMEDTDFGGAGPLPSPSMRGPDSQESGDFTFQAAIVLPPPDVHTPDSQGTEEEDIQTGEFLQPSSVQTPDSQGPKDSDSQRSEGLPQSSQVYSDSQQEILETDNPAEMARKYKEEGWKAYLAKTQPQTQSAGSSSRLCD